MNEQKRVEQVTILVEDVHVDIISCKARKDFTFCQVSVKAGGRFFLIRSDRFSNRFYVVGWNEERIGWQCSCGAGCKTHSHVKKANLSVKAHLKSASTLERKVREKVAECQVVAHTENIQPGRPLTVQEWKETLKRQKARDRAYKQKILESAKEIAEVNCQVAGAS